MIGEIGAAILLLDSLHEEQCTADLSHSGFSLTLFRASFFSFCYCAQYFFYSVNHFQKLSRSFYRVCLICTEVLCSSSRTVVYFVCHELPVLLLVFSH